MSFEDKAFIHIVAPFRCHLSIDRPLMAMHKKEFNAFMKSLSKLMGSKDGLFAEAIKEGVNVSVNSSYSNCMIQDHYDIINSNGNEFKSPHLIEFDFDRVIESRCHEIFKESMEVADKIAGVDYSSMLIPCFNSLNIKVYDLTVSICEFDLIVDENSDYCKCKDGWNDIDEWISNFSKSFTSLFYREYVYSVLSSITQLSEEQEYSFYVPPHKYTVCHDMADLALQCEKDSPLMWSATTLVMPKGKFSNKWVEEARNDNKDDVINVEGAQLNVNWGNNLFEVEDSKKFKVEEFWKGVVVSHSYYAKFDIINNNLSTFVGQTFTNSSNKTISEASALLEDVINSINILKLDYKDRIQGIRQLPKIIFHRLMFVEWDIDNLIRACDMKRELCQDNLSRLNHTINSRNSGRVQIVLTLLAALGIVNLMVSVSSTARTLEMYHILERGSLPIPSIMEMALYLTPDTMAWIGCILGLIAGGIIIANRPR